MNTRISIEKTEKEESLFEAAYELFLEKGIHDTSINSIVKKAGVAKGTFYLYYENKYDLLEKIILEKSRVVLNEAIERTRKGNYRSFEDEVLAFVDYIIEYLKENKLLLKLMHKNLSWGLYKRASEDYQELHQLYELFEKGYVNTELSRVEIRNRLFMIIELTGSVSYSAIILREPADIDSIKDSLFNAIRKII